uniref:Ral GTPase-activating protein subunit beta n=1 Tax=Ascaris suum TaxID=6253 RepID=F1KRP0_ASCSU
MDSEGRPLVAGLGEEMSVYTLGKLRQCFFMACAAVSKLINIFYGDSKVSVEFRESDELMRQWAESGRTLYEEWLKHQQAIQRSSSGSVGAGDNGTLTASGQSVQGGSVGSAGGNILKSAFGIQGSSHSSKTRPASERSLLVNSTAPSSGVISSSDMPPEIPKPSASQFVWHYLRSNRVYPPYVGERQPKVSRMLDMFMDWLVQSSLVRPARYRQTEALSDVGSQRSMSSFGTDEAVMEGTASGAEGGHASTSESAVTRRSFAQSTASSGDAHSFAMATLEWPGVDGISAGRAAAIGALCRIICSKTSKEALADSQLAQFYKVIHEALLERDRLILCSVIYFGENMFRLGLKGVEVLLPLFVVAIDIILTESAKLRLHPSISEVEMRRACLRCLSSIISWPTTFGSARIADPSHISFSSSGYSIPEEHSTSYIELRPRIHRNLIYSLRHETDAANLHLTLALCNILCEESCTYDMCFAEERLLKEQSGTRKGGEDDTEADKGYCVSVLRSVVSAICDNMCKPQWSSELSVCLAAIDCLNAVTNLHPSMLFYRRDLSTGFLIVTSLCRFIDTQLMKPPPLHSRDLHSSVVAAYTSLAVWLCAAPLLVETESCLATVAETIEFGVYGGKNLAISERKAASKRVHDAAEFLLYNLFTAVGRRRINGIVDERRLLYRYGPQAIDTTKFRHFLVKQQTLISIYEATKLTHISQGRPSLFFVVRTPHHAATATVARLYARPDAADGQNVNENEDDSPVNSENKTSNAAVVEPPKSFQIPASVYKPMCKLDSVIPPLHPTPETDKILMELRDIRRTMQGSESCRRASDERNVWLREPLASELAKPIQPMPAVSECDAGRVFLYDMGLISEEAFKARDILMLDSARSDEFYCDLHEMVDRSPTKLIQSVSLFYVRDGQKTASEILENAMNLQSVCGEFCAMLAELGEGVEVATHPHWTGNWRTAFSSERKPFDEQNGGDHFVLDGHSHCLWWADAHVEVAYTMPTERCRRKSPESGEAEPTVAGYNDEQSDPEGSSSKLQRAGNQCSSSGDERSTGRASGGSARSSGGTSEPHVPAASKSKSTTNISNGSFGERGGSSLVKRNADQRVFVIWLERFEDMRHFPTEEMFAVTGDGSSHQYNRPGRPDCVAIFLHQIETGLIRIHVNGDWTKCGLPGPLVDGCVVSESVLPSLLRLTVISIARRKTVELENYQMVYCRRRMAIQDFARKYAITQTYTDFIERLITP